MLTIKDIIESVREENLSRDRLEEFYSTLSSLSAEMHLRMAFLEKREAGYFADAHKNLEVITDISIKRSWNITTEGMEMIDLKHQLRACDKLLSSVKHRIFNTL